MTEEERDALLLRLESVVGRIDVFVRAMAHKLLAPAEIAELDAKVLESETVAAD